MAGSSTRGLIGPSAAPGVSLMNFHNQGRSRAQYQGDPNSAGFAVEFLSTKDVNAFEVAIISGAVVVQDTVIGAVVPTIETMKLKLRHYFDGVFSSSHMTRNLHRRASNAIVQSTIYNDIGNKGQFTGLIYSKLGRGKGPASFVDYLLLHLMGGTIEPRNKGLLMLAVSDDARALQSKGGFIPTGYYPGGSRVFFAQAKDDPNKLFLLRAPSRTGKTQLLAVLLKSVQIAPGLSGLQPLLDEAGAILERNADDQWQQRLAATKGAD